MTELELYKFINNNNIEWHRRDNEGTPDVIIFPFIFHIEEFNKLVRNSAVEGIECTMKDDYFAFWMKDICEYYGVNMDNIFINER